MQHIMNRINYSKHKPSSKAIILFYILNFQFNSVRLSVNDFCHSI